MADADGEEVLAASSSGRPEDERFDTIVGHLQDIVMDEKFQTTRDDFIYKHKDTFEDEDENKLEYTPIFKEWVALIESHLNSELAARMPGFKMEEFMKMLGTRHDEIDVELLDMLLTLGDFQSFKETMVMSKSGGGGFDDALVIGHV